MALCTLQGIKEIGGFEVARHNEPNAFSKYIIINEPNNCIAFVLQNGPIKENGVNGCQIETVIETAKIIFQELNKIVPCQTNEGAIAGLESALAWLKWRLINREARGVEGTNAE